MEKILDKLRSINTKFWDDNYIINLTPTEKLLFLYLLTNPLTNLIGIYEIALLRISFDTGMSRQIIKKMLAKFEADGKICYKNGFIIIFNFEKHQRYNSNMKTGADKLRQNLPLEIRTIAKSFERVSNHKNKSRKKFTQDEYEYEDEKEGEGKEKTAHLFSSSPYYDKTKFIERFYSNPKYQKYDAEHYYESVRLWSESGGKKKIDWIATAYNFARGDKQPKMNPKNELPR